MKDARVEMSVMTRDVDNAQRAYDAVLGRLVSNKIDSAAKTTNVSMLTPAVEPVKPAHPKLGLIATLSVLVGGMLAAAVVYILESLDRRRAAHDRAAAIVPLRGIASRSETMPRICIRRRGHARRCR
jgi:uncharacterized protein involved in exopolysaccharide biosynthesis